MYSDTYHQFLRAVEAQDHDSNVHVAFQLESLRYVLVRDLLRVLKNEEEGAHKVSRLLLGAHEIAMQSGNEDARLAVLRIAKRLHADTAARTIYDSMADPDTKLGIRRIEAFICWHTPTVRQLFGKPATFGVLTP